jgi:chorismate--pyruvate lyase
MPSHTRKSLYVARRGREDVFWKSIDFSSRKIIPNERLKDLLDQGSLTHLLIQKSGGDFKVKVLAQSWQFPTLSECARLQIKHRQYAFVREVALLCKGEVWVMARSVIPKATLKGKLKHLTHLGSRPLGATLFKDPSLERTLFEVSQIDNFYLRGKLKLSNKEVCWGRRSVFRLQKKLVLVEEVFLPACPPLHH